MLYLIRFESMLYLIRCRILTQNGILCQNNPYIIRNGDRCNTMQKVKRLSIKLTEISKQLQHFNIILILIKDYVIVL